LEKDLLGRVPAVRRGILRIELSHDLLELLLLNANQFQIATRTLQRRFACFELFALVPMIIEEILEVFTEQFLIRYIHVPLFPSSLVQIVTDA
jgi:hypothetical protein